jgi:hypothetical protein
MGGTSLDIALVAAGQLTFRTLFRSFEQFWKCPLERGVDELYTDYFMRHNPLWL